MNHTWKSDHASANVTNRLLDAVSPNENGNSETGEEKEELAKLRQLDGVKQN